MTTFFPTFVPVKKYNRMLINSIILSHDLWASQLKVTKNLEFFTIVNLIYNRLQNKL